MFDSANNTGGCQDIYTVYPALNSSITGPPICTNLSYPHPNQVLNVDVTTSAGGFSQYGWIDQCTDISVHPINGTPPYTLTIAPTLRPPYIITSETNNPINWTVSLSWGSSFFVSVTDSVGNLWSAGPLHSGTGANTACLDENGASQPKSSRNRTWITAVASSCSALLGVLLGLLVPVLFARCRMRRVQPRHQRKRSDPTTSRTGLVSPFEDRDTVCSVHAEQGTSTELAESPTGWPETPNSGRTTKKSGDLRRTPTTTDSLSSTVPMSIDAQPPSSPREVPDEVLDVPVARDFDLPPRYRSPLDARFRLAPAPQGASRLRPLPTPPTPPAIAHIHEE
ncbi:hypothetical protein PsYK624_162170 [Phanerochaete sordida]|uniref:Uncharacterized protein n=1 Tax=Phanerochaete sordida TaxID=48140 RepID=A0A9P3LLW2_9APHY|nr:hypothetical protein PsYK624_162170 [Phanerochaete sordida]